MSWNCDECHERIDGRTMLVDTVALHEKCAVRRQHRKAGRPFECPVCKGVGRWHHEASIHDHTLDPDFGYNGEGGPGDTRSYRELIPARTETCEQCHGYGYVAKEPQQVPTGMKWVTE